MLGLNRRALACLLALGLMTAGCGKDDDPADTDPDTDTDTNTEESSENEAGGGGSDDGAAMAMPDIGAVTDMFSDCSTDADCGDGETCELDALFGAVGACVAPTGTMLEDGIAGKACADDSDCGSGTCLTENAGFGGGMATPLEQPVCTAPCRADSECGGGAACVGAIAAGALFNMDGQCFNECDTANGDDDCAAGLTCQGGGGMGGIPGMMGGGMMAPPAGPGTCGFGFGGGGGGGGGGGAPCTSQADCQPGQTCGDVTGGNAPTPVLQCMGEAIVGEDAGVPLSGDAGS